MMGHVIFHDGESFSTTTVDAKEKKRWRSVETIGYGKWVHRWLQHKSGWNPRRMKRGDSLVSTSRFCLYNGNDAYEGRWGDNKQHSAGTIWDSEPHQGRVVVDCKKVDVEMESTCSLILEENLAWIFIGDMCQLMKHHINCFFFGGVHITQTRTYTCHWYEI